MEMKFQANSLRSLRRTADRQQLQEQTQEVRLADSMPDIGRVLGSWGRVLIRGKEWRSSGMSVSGGVMVWVLYAPEDGSEPRSVETWIPFQMKWDFPESKHDGYILAIPGLKAVDARSISARKLMVRANICLQGTAMEMAEADYYVPDGVPEDVNLLVSDYPMQIPFEFGEKLTPIAEELTLPAGAPAVQTLLRYDMEACVTEQKILASRMVFRGSANVHLMYLNDGKIYSADCQVPFSQYTDLDRDYTPAAVARIVPMPTNLELELAEGHLQLKAELAAQYIVYDRVMVQMTEDAYSNHRTLGLQHCQLQLSQRLDQQQETLQLEETVDAEADTIADISMHWELPQRQQNGDISRILIPGQVQVLYYDAQQMLRSASARFETMKEMAADGGTSIACYLHTAAQPRAVIAGKQVQVAAALETQTETVTEDGTWMVCGLEMEEIKEPDPGRPSLILRRFSGGRLWDEAKACGSTVAAIRSANTLEKDPDKGQILLIPVS